MLLIGGHLALLAAGDPAAAPWSTLAALAVGQLGLLLVVGSLRVTPRLGGGALLAVALLLRALLLPLPSTLSDDLERYLWDGHMVLAGLDPYAWAPDDPKLAPLRTGSYLEVPHGEVATVYPPAALAFFSIAAASPSPSATWRLLVVAGDLVACVVLWRLAKRRGLPLELVAWYAWNPLVTLEVAVGGHVDALAGLGVVIAVAALARSGDPSLSRPVPAAGSTVTAACGFAFGVATKLWPLVLLVGLTRAAAKPQRRLLWWVSLLSVAALVPMFAGGLPSGLVTYVRSWEFSGPLYEPMWRLLDALRVEAGLHRLFDAGEALVGRYDLFDPFYQWVYPQLTARSILLAAAAVVWWRLGRRAPPRDVVGPRRAPGDVGVASGRLAVDSSASHGPDPLRLAFLGCGWLLLASPTVYPWYLLAVLPWAALAGQAGWPWLLAAALAPVGYLASLGVAPLWPTVWAVCWLPPAALALAQRLVSSRRDVGAELT